MIIAAAIKIGDLVLTMPRPARHFTILHELVRVMDVEAWKGRAELIALPKHEQGFLDSDGRFMGRVEAAKHAIANQQIEDEPSHDLRQRGFLNHPPNLYSEDLW